MWPKGRKSRTFGTNRFCRFGMQFFYVQVECMTPRQPQTSMCDSLASCSVGAGAESWASRLCRFVEKLRTTFSPFFLLPSSFPPFFLPTYLSLSFSSPLHLSASFNLFSSLTMSVSLCLSFFPFLCLSLYLPLSLPLSLLHP